MNGGYTMQRTEESKRMNNCLSATGKITGKEGKKLNSLLQRVLPALNYDFIIVTVDLLFLKGLSACLNNFLKNFSQAFKLNEKLSLAYEYIRRNFANYSQDYF